ncbi:MAG: hypothetical protein R3D02_14265 [Hyphomicrobiales bacterium]
MLLLLSNSIDGTADVIVELCEKRGEPVFRFNIDLWTQYRFAWTPDGYAFEDPTGRKVTSAEVTACLWRRPSLRDTPDWEGGSPEDRPATEAELHTLMRELADHARARGVLRLMEPFGGRRVGRLTQMRIAREFFAVPGWAAGWGLRWPPGRRMVKRLTTEGVGADRDHYIFVQSVDSERLAPGWPWLLQEIAPGSRDATVVYVAGQSFGFEMEKTRADLEVEDWRIRNGATTDKWRDWAMPAGLAEAIRAYMDRLGLHYGRLDFIAGDGEPAFLEVNPNGQFGWLDDPDGWPLHRAVLDAVLDPAFSITGAEVARETIAREIRGRGAEAARRPSPSPDAGVFSIPLKPFFD